MSKFRKQTWLVLLGLLVIGVSVPILKSASSDIVALVGGGSLNNIEVFRVDSNGDVYVTDSNSYTGASIDSTTGELTIKSGDIVVGGGGTRPSTSVYPGNLVPFYNASGQTLTSGDLLIASTDTTGGAATIQAVTATTTIVGVCDATVLNTAVGYMRVDGYAIVKATGAIILGDLVVSTATHAPSGTKGIAGRIAPGATVEVGSVLGKAMSGQAANTSGNILVLLQ